MNLITAISCASIIATTSAAGAGIVFGNDAEMEFIQLQLDHNEGFLDFESAPVGTNLLPGADYFGVGVHFASIITTHGQPFGPEHVEVTGQYNASYGNTIVGSPFQFGSDDGRVGYEIAFDSLQRRAGIRRISGAAITRFYNADDDLLYEHLNTESHEFVGWMADSDDQSTWVARMVMDAVRDSSGVGQVGYSDDLYFGTIVPAPAGITAILLSFGYLSRSRRR